MVYSHCDHMLFQLFWLKFYCNDDTLMSKWYDISNCLDNLFQRPWFGTLWCRGSYFVSFKYIYSFPDGVNLWRVIRYVIFCWRFSVSYTNRTWSLGLVALWFYVFSVSKVFDLTSTVKCVSEMFVVCGMDMGLVWMRSSIVCIS